MDLSYAAPHAIGDGQLQNKNQTETDIRFSYIKDQNRRLFAGTM